MSRRRKDATGALFDGSKSGKRVQRVYTPQCVIDVLDLVWPEGVLMDPCSGPHSLVRAAIRIMPPQNGCRYALTVPALGEDGEHVTDETTGKLVYVPAPPGPPWPERTYVNTEFSSLQPWLLQFAESWECQFLVPVRPQRGWWRAAARTASVIAELDPFAFVGHDQVFPAPLALMYRGARVDAFRNAIETTKIGECRP